MCVERSFLALRNLLGPPYFVGSSSCAARPCEDDSERVFLVKLSEIFNQFTREFRQRKIVWLNHIFISVFVIILIILHF